MPRTPVRRRPNRQDSKKTLVHDGPRRRRPWWHRVGNPAGYIARVRHTTACPPGGAVLLGVAGGVPDRVGDRRVGVADADGVRAPDFVAAREGVGDVVAAREGVDDFVAGRVRVPDRVPLLVESLDRVELGVAVAGGVVDCVGRGVRVPVGVGFEVTVVDGVLADECVDDEDGARVWVLDLEREAPCERLDTDVLDAAGDRVKGGDAVAVAVYVDAGVLDCAGVLVDTGETELDDVTVGSAVAAGIADTEDVADCAGVGEADNVPATAGVSVAADVADEDDEGVDSGVADPEDDDDLVADPEDDDDLVADTEDEDDPVEDPENKEDPDKEPEDEAADV